MATVLDASGNSPLGVADKPLTRPNAIVTSDPYGSRTPLYAGEIVYDRSNHRYYRANGLANTDWQSFGHGNSQDQSQLARTMAFGIASL